MRRFNKASEDINSNHNNENNSISNHSMDLKGRLNNIANGLGGLFALVISEILFFLIVLGFDNKLKQPILLIILSIILICFLMIYGAITTISSGTTFRLSFLLKRFLDILIAAFVMSYLSPFIILISIAIKLDSRGPILFRIRRAGQCGKSFDCFKFRTLNYGVKDYHVTRVGKFLRRFSLDELPMFINVLIGEMSVVGPRPRQVQELEDLNDQYKRIISMKPGICGLWQISYHRDSESFLKSDIRYVDQWSLTLDVKIMLASLWVLVSGTERKE